jgi:hypothetical protein
MLLTLEELGYPVDWLYTQGEDWAPKQWVKAGAHALLRGATAGGDSGGRLRGMNDAWNRLRPLLRQGEQLRWVGQPDPRVRLTAADLFLVPFSIMWASFMVFWEFKAIETGASVFFILWGIPFVLIGLYITVGRFIYKRGRQLMTVYGLTDSRAIVSYSERSFIETSLKGSQMRVDRSRDGRHVSVIFGNRRQVDYRNTGLDVLNLGQAQGVAFFDVADPDALMRELDRVR